MNEQLVQAQQIRLAVLTDEICKALRPADPLIYFVKGEDGRFDELRDLHLIPKLNNLLNVLLGGTASLVGKPYVELRSLQKSVNKVYENILYVVTSALARPIPWNEEIAKLVFQVAHLQVQQHVEAQRFVVLMDGKTKSPEQCFKKLKEMANSGRSDKRWLVNVLRFILGIHQCYAQVIF